MVEAQRVPAKVGTRFGLNAGFPLESVPRYRGSGSVLPSPAPADRNLGHIGAGGGDGGLDHDGRGGGARIIIAARYEARRLRRRDDGFSRTAMPLRPVRPGGIGRRVAIDARSTLDLPFEPAFLTAAESSEERRVGKECVRTCRARWG